MNDLLQNEKLMWAQEKVKILVAIWASLPVIAEEAALLQAAAVPNPDACYYHGGNYQLLRGTWDPPLGELTSQGPRIIGALVSPMCLNYP